MDTRFKSSLTRNIFLFAQAWTNIRATRVQTNPWIGVHPSSIVGLLPRNVIIKLFY